MLDRFVQYNARRHGDVLAFGGFSRQCRFDRLEASVSRLARSLQGLCHLELKLVAVQCIDSWRHWMLLLVLGRLGIASVSLPGTDVSQEMLAILSPDLIVLHDGDLPEQEGRLVLNDAWFRHVLDGVEHDSSVNYFTPVAVKPDTLCRVAVTMGTDRDMHVVGFSYADIEAALLRLVYQDLHEALAMIISKEEKPHLLCTINSVSMSGFLMVGAALVAGMTVRGVEQNNMGAEVAQGHPLFVILTPVHLEQLLKVLPPGMNSMDHIYLTVVGAPLSDVVLERTYRFLTPHVRVAYGIDECGLVSSIVASKRENETSVGHVLPWVDVEIVNGDKVPLSVGESGVVRVRTSGAAREYLHEPDVTEKKFDNEWFYPGDRGLISSKGELSLCGRVDDIVAIGGGKFDLATLDYIAKEVAVVQDAAFFVLWNKEGQQVLYCALATNGKVDCEALSNKLRFRYTDLPQVSVLWVEDIPYTDSGYVDRERLKRSLTVHLRRQ